MQSLTDRHRPKTLGDLYGQGAIACQLEAFSEAPYSCGMLFSGPTGTGKTSAAHALANDLGVDVAEGPFGGWYPIPSGEQTAESVRETLRMIRTTPMMGSGWRVVLIDEADRMSKAVRYLWLSALEDIPPRTLVVFTTNMPEEFEDRFLDRCERFEFRWEGATLMQDARALAREVWRRETGSEAGCPDVSRVAGIVDDKGRISFRRVVTALAGPLRMAGARAPEFIPPRVGRKDLNGRALPAIDAPRGMRPSDPAPFSLRAPAADPRLPMTTVYAGGTRGQTLPTSGSQPRGLGSALTLMAENRARKGGGR